MEDKLIEYSTAKLAKEKQFQEYTSYFYTKENGLCSIDTDGEILKIYNDDLTFKDSIWDCNGDFWYNEIEDEEWIYAQTYEPIKYPAPTQSLLQKWLREVHSIHINGEVRWNNFKKKELIYEFWIKDMREVKPSTRVHTEPSILSYEEALEKGLQEALKLI